MRALVAGASGFLGSRVVELLHNHGYTVITADKLGLNDYTGDLSDPGFSAKLPDVDVVLNCAAVQYVTKNKPLFDWPDYFYKNNVLVVKNLLARYEKLNVHFIQLGTSMQYQQNGSYSYDENSTMAPQGVYSWSKVEAQKLINGSKLDVATVLPCIIGGAGREGLFTSFVKTISLFSIAIVPGKGDYPTSIVHVDDVAMLLLRIVKGRNVGFYNVAANEALSINEWVEIVRLKLNKKRLLILRIPLFPLKIISKIMGYRLLASEQLYMLSMPHVLDVSKSTRELNFQPRSPVKIIQDITDYLVDH
jgi:nucleoside-diphosphate-sugar epimerase